MLKTTTLKLMTGNELDNLLMLCDLARFNTTGPVNYKINDFMDLILKIKEGKE